MGQQTQKKVRERCGVQNADVTTQSMWLWAWHPLRALRGAGWRGVKKAAAKLPTTSLLSVPLSGTHCGYLPVYTTLSQKAAFAEFPEASKPRGAAHLLLTQASPELWAALTPPILFIGFNRAQWHPTCGQGHFSISLVLWDAKCHPGQQTNSGNKMLSPQFQQTAHSSSIIISILKVLWACSKSHCLESGISLFS